MSSTKENKETTVLIGYLCCLSTSAHIIPGFTHLPLLLVKATSALSRIFLSWLHVMFDCYTSHLTINGPEMRYFMTQFVIGSEGGWGEDESHCVTCRDTGHKVVAVYDSPAEIKEAGLSEVTLELSAIDTADIMSRSVTACVSIPSMSPILACIKTSQMIKLEQVLLLHNLLTYPNN